MNIINLNKEEMEKYNIGVGLGNFDGIHRGHKELLLSLVRESKKRDLSPSVLLFLNHPKTRIEKNHPKIITNFKKKLEILEEIGIENVFTLDFTEEFMRLSRDKFIDDIIIKKLKAKLVVVGFDYRFGYRACGDIDFLLDYGTNKGLDIFVLDPVYINKQVVSSTNIRKAIESGRIDFGNKLLGREYSLIGRVVHGEKRGSKMGFPTANIQYNKKLLIPKEGVYRTYVKLLGKSYRALTNIGYNPTFDGQELRIETYIIDFSRDIYGEEIEVFFQEYIREVVRFKSKEDLIFQMEKDLAYIINS